LTLDKSREICAFTFAVRFAAGCNIASVSRGGGFFDNLSECQLFSNGSGLWSSPMHNSRECLFIHTESSGSRRAGARCRKRFRIRFR